MRASHKLSVACIATALGALAPSTSHAGTGKAVAGPPHTLELKVVFTDAHLGGPPQPWTQEEVDSWKPLFEAASRGLWDATEKQLTIGKITTFFDCPAQLDDADIIIDRSNGNVAANRGGLGKRGRNVSFTNRYKNPATGGATAMVHELGHYLFGLYDEYEGEVIYTSVPKELPRIHMDDIPLVPGTSAFRYHFCETMTEGGDSATFMDASNKHGLKRTEFCTAHDHATGSGHQIGYVLEPTLMVNGWEMGGVYKTEQQVKAGLSGWEHIAAVSEAKLGIKLVAPEGKPVSDSAGVPTLQWEAGSCLPKIVLVIDRSGSMDSSAKMAQAKSTATQVAATISDGAMLGVVSFASGAVTNYPVTVVDEQARQGAFVAIALMSAYGSTNIGGGLLQGLSEITGSERVDEEVVVLISDGEHTTGTPPEQALPLLVAEGVKVHTIGIGQAIPTELLLTLSGATGGSSAFPQDNFGMVESMSRLSLSAEGHHPIVTTEGTLASGAGQTIEVLVDETNDQLVVVQQWTNGGMDLTLTDPNDVTFDADSASTNPDVHHVAGWTSLFYRIQNPTPGTWTLTTQAADTNILPSKYGLQVYDRSDSILVTAEAPPAAADYPAPFLVATNVTVGSQRIVGATVTAEVTRPDGSVVTVTLHDDGQAGHGDEDADDGTYSHLFGKYAGSGVYNVKVIVENESGTTGGGEFTIDEDHEPQTVLAFRRESHVS
ncbi:MAG: VWA domain-containing protein, partial [Deltaproteobacteria bacterium]|nr:VWA domain-containing protein [Deltaproteobacteria bacterium]